MMADLFKSQFAPKFTDRGETLLKQIYFIVVILGFLSAIAISSLRSEALITIMFVIGIWLLAVISITVLLVGYVVSSRRQLALELEKRDKQSGNDSST